MFSAYVVVGEPPTAVAIEDRAPHDGVKVVAGHCRDRLDVAGVLRDQRDHRGQCQHNG